MRTVEFRQLLDDLNAVRVHFELERDEVLQFVVRLECRFKDRWQPVVCYDTAHQFAHRVLIHPSGTVEKTALPIQDYDAALTFAMKDLKAHWQQYRGGFERWLGDK